MPFFHGQTESLIASTGDSLVTLRPDAGSSDGSIQGAIYDIRSSRWAAIPYRDTVGPGFASAAETAIWTGQQFLLFKRSQDEQLIYTVRYTPSAPLYLYQKQ